jgi:agmatine deiminase
MVGRFIRIGVAALCVLTAIVTDAPGRAEVARTRLPAEYEPVEAVMVVWPDGTPFAAAYPALVAALARRAQAIIVVPDAQAEERVATALGRQGVPASQVRYLRMPADTMWIRDYGPLYTFTEGAGAARAKLYDLRYEPVGFAPLRHDDALPQSVAAAVQSPVERLDLIIEGGNLLSDGLGTCFTSPTLFFRNRALGELAIRKLAVRHFGCDELVVLPILAGEATGHVDLILKVASPTTLLVARCADSRDQSCTMLDEVAARLRGTRNRHGRPYQVHRVPLARLGWVGQQRQYASYANSLIVNGAVLVPAFGLPEDDLAMQAYREALPGLDIVAVDAAPLTYLGGSLHCITLAVPRLP